MSKTNQKEVFRSGLLAMWGLGTLVLVFSVILLVYELSQREETPYTAANPKTNDGPTALTETESSAMREVQLYFASPQGAALVAETRPIELSERTVDNCRKILAALIEGPRDLLAPVLSPSTSVRGVYLMPGGELIVDFSRELEMGHIPSASAELLMVHAIVISLTQPAIKGRVGDRVGSVRFLFAGSPPTNTFPSHIDLSEPVTPDLNWIKKPTALEGSADGR